MRKLWLLAIVMVCAFAFAQVNPMFTGQNVKRGPTSWWGFCGDTTATSGCVASATTTVYDRTSGAHALTWTGTQAGTTNWYNAGNVGPFSGAFNGTDDYANVASFDCIGLSQTTFSIVAWINVSTSGNYQILDCSSTNANYVHFGIYSGQVGWRVVQGANTARRQQTTAQTLTSAGWHCIALTKSGNNDVVVYVDGVVDATRAAQSVDNASVNSVQSTVGRVSVTPFEYFKGTLGPVMVWNYRQLAQQQVVNLCAIHN